MSLRFAGSTVSSETW
uniref:Uncharacterized protein n=1 Tax=Zea mays TaxID=4577 RepID=C4J867_MAIZE|nr:unknown [Zea mays]